jgi:hypothetical protein
MFQAIKFGIKMKTKLPKSCNSKSCSSASVKAAKSIQNGKGDKIRPFSKNKYDKNYESINWKRK